MSDERHLLPFSPPLTHTPSWLKKLFANSSSITKTKVVIQQLSSIWQTQSQATSPTSDVKVTDIVAPILKVVKEVSAVFPPLQGAVGGLCECFEIYKV